MEFGMAETCVRNFGCPAAYLESPRYLHSEGEPAWYFYFAEIALRRLQNCVLMSFILNGHLIDRLEMIYWPSNQESGFYYLGIGKMTS